MTGGRPRLEAMGESAVIVTLGDTVDEATNGRVHRVSRAFARLHVDDPRFGMPVPAYATVLVPVDPIDPGVDRAIDQLTAVATAADTDEPVEADPAPLVSVPTRYGGVDGPDLADVAAHHGLSPGEVVEIHASVEYRVYFLGFAPGFAYLGRLPARIATPRLATPRLKVPAGSVAIAGDQTAIYPVESPGGWRLIGRTDVRVWDVTADSPALLSPGARVRFVPTIG
jgi:inhibitor of KinA